MSTTSFVSNNNNNDKKRYHWVPSIINNIHPLQRFLVIGYARKLKLKIIPPLVILNIILAYYYSCEALKNLKNIIYTQLPPWNYNDIHSKSIKNKEIIVIDLFNQIQSILFPNNVCFLKYQLESIKQFINISNKHCYILNYIYEIIYQQGKQDRININNNFNQKILNFLNLLLEYILVDHPTNISKFIIPKQEQALQTLQNFLSILVLFILEIDDDIYRHKVDCFDIHTKTIIYQTLTLLTNSSEVLKYFTNQCNIIEAINQDVQYFVNELQITEYQLNRCQNNRLDNILNFFLNLFEFPVSFGDAADILQLEQLIRIHKANFTNILQNLVSKELCIHHYAHQKNALFSIIYIFYHLISYENCGCQPILILKDSNSLSFFIQCITKGKGNHIKKICLEFFNKQISIWTNSSHHNNIPNRNISTVEEDEEEKLLEDIIDSGFMKILINNRSMKKILKHGCSHLHTIYQCIYICTRSRHLLLDCLYKIIQIDGLIGFILNSSEDPQMCSIIQKILLLFNHPEIQSSNDNTNKIHHILSTLIRFNECQLLKILCKLLTDEYNIYDVLICIVLLNDISDYSTQSGLAIFIDNKIETSNIFSIMNKLELITNINGKYEMSHKLQCLLNINLNHDYNTFSFYASITKMMQKYSGSSGTQ